MGEEYIGGRNLNERIHRRCPEAREDIHHIIDVHSRLKPANYASYKIQKRSQKVDGPPSKLEGRRLKNYTPNCEERETQRCADIQIIDSCVEVILQRNLALLAPAFNKMTMLAMAAEDVPRQAHSN
jgi:hypothetical protein